MTKRLLFILMLLQVCFVCYSSETMLDLPVAEVWQTSSLQPNQVFEDEVFNRLREFWSTIESGDDIFEGRNNIFYDKVLISYAESLKGRSAPAA